MFLKIWVLWSNINVAIFPFFYRFDVNDVIVTSREFFFCLFILVDMDKGNQVLYKDIKWWLQQTLPLLGINPKRAGLFGPISQPGGGADSVSRKPIEEISSVWY